MAREKRGAQNYGGPHSKWDRLHPLEVKEIEESLAADATDAPGRRSPDQLWHVLNRWALYRYQVARSHCLECGHKRIRGAGRIELMEWVPAAKVNQPAAPSSEEKLPWE